MNQQPRKARPPYAISRQGSSYGSEEKVEARWSSANLKHIKDLWSLNEEQYKQLVLMQDKLADIDHWKNNPYEATRFIMGPQGYEKAEELFRLMIEWRIDNSVDTILETYRPPKTLLHFLPSAILAGYDREGDAIYVERGGVCDCAGLLQRYGRERLMKHIIWSRELASRGRWIQEYERKMGRPPTRLTIVYDLQGLNSRHMKAGVLPFLNESMRMTQQRYNGLAKRMIIIRAPSLFNVVWSMCKRAFPKGAQKKMVFSGPHDYLQVLEKYIDLQVLPPCIMPGGRGKPGIDMPPRLEGGLISEDNISVAEEANSTQTALEYESATCSQASSDSDAEKSRVRRGMRSKKSCSVSVRGKRLIGGRWLAIKSSSKTVTVLH